ncbi:MAG TPA: PEP-CTERM sorting domain-containing protein [Burkholderiales bacterium]|nr:PEP-CTERM sorting domain-containing protein [Burkholderiales bacterium]
MSFILRRFAPVVAALGVAAAPSPSYALAVFSGSGASATTAFNDFNTAIQVVPNPRRINWDGVKLDGTDANPNTRVIVNNSTVEIPIDRFRNVGAIYADPYSVSGDGFAGVNPATAGQFPAFTPNNTFAMFDTNPGEFNDRFIQQTFVLANTNTPAATRGFGAIFIDVEQAGSSSIEYFGTNSKGEKVSLGKFNVPTGASGEPEFLGVLFDAPIITEVELTLGTNALFNFDGTSFQSFGPENLAQGIDLAVTDDFLFANPELAQVVAVPEPGTIALLGGVLSGLILVRRRAK